MAAAQQQYPSVIPSLSGFDSETRQAIELACILKKSDGPVAYGTCLNEQISSLNGSPGIPSLSGLDREARQSIELACILKKSDGPAKYANCLNQQLVAFRGSDGIPSLAAYDRETRQSIELACILKKSDGPVAYAGCLNRQIASLKGLTQTTSQTPSQAPIRTSQEDDGSQARLPNPTDRAISQNSTSASGGHAVSPAVQTSRFTTEKIMKVHQGVSAEKILELFGAPKNISQAVCGAKVGKPWSCTTWEYGDFSDEWATFTFGGINGALKLNNFEIHRN
jgi:hypothetical protein